MRGRGACMPGRGLGGHAWQGDVHDQGACVAGGGHGRGVHGMHGPLPTHTTR